MKSVRWKTQDDYLLVVASALGRTRAFDELTKRYWGPVFSLARQICGSRETAEDIAQEAFMQAYRNMYQLKDPEKFSGWLCAIARNIAIRSLSRANARADKVMPLQPKTVEPSPYETAERKEAVDRLRQALKHLGADLRIVLELRYWHSMKIADIASFLDMPEATVKWRLQKAKSILGQELRDVTGGWDDG